MQSIHQLLYLGERVSVLHNDFIQGTVVNAHPPLSILFGDEKYWCPVRTRTWPYPALLQECIDLSLHFIQFSTAQPVWASMRWCCSWCSLYLMIDDSLGRWPLWQFIREDISVFLQCFSQSVPDGWICFCHLSPYHFFNWNLSLDGASFFG